MPHSIMRLLPIILLLIFSQSARAERTDVVFLHNGDRITGEVKGLWRGKLEFKTDHMGTLYIEWDDIMEVVSDTGQAVELTNGQRFHGPLGKPDNEDMVIVNTEQGPVGLNTLDIVAMYPVESNFWQRLDLNVSLGFSWDKGSNVGKYNFGVDATYRRKKSITRAGLSTEVTTQGETDDTTRANLSAVHNIFMGNKRFRSYFGNMEHSDELGIDLRTLVGAGYGWIPIRSQKNWFSLAAGLDVNHEVPILGEPETNLEGVGMLMYEYYKYSSPERSFTVDFKVFPSLTDFGRWRADFDTTLKIEFVRDFYWQFDLFANYDSAPISKEGASTDYGVISSLAYKF